MPVPWLATKPKKRIPVVWDEVLDLGDSHLHGNKDGSDEINNLPSGTVIQWWRSWSSNVIERATARSFKVVQSHSYYLDHLDTDWVNMYHAVLNDQLLGGEACSWSEHVSSINVEHQIFSKLPAVAETCDEAALKLDTDAKSEADTAFGTVKISIEKENQKQTDALDKEENDLDTTTASAVSDAKTLCVIKKRKKR